MGKRGALWRCFGFVFVLFLHLVWCSFNVGSFMYRLRLLLLGFFNQMGHVLV